MASTDPTQPKPSADIAFDAETSERLRTYFETLTKWQRAINLVSKKTLEDGWRRHVLDSAQLAEEISPGEHIADLGSGAGLPGLVLAIVTGNPVTLIESDQRKATFIREAARLTETDVVVLATRIEDAPGVAADVVTARALAPLPRLLPWVYRHAKKGGKALLLKGADVDQELTLAAKEWTMNTSRKRSISDASGTILIVTGLAPTHVGE